MRTFLVDENLSPAVAHYLAGLGYEAVAVRDAGLRGATDKEIIRYLQEKQRILITSDLDFGEFFYGKELGSFGVIILRSASQNTVSFQTILDDLHKQGALRDSRLDNSILVAGEKGYRWRKFQK